MRRAENPVIPNEICEGNADVPSRLLRLSRAVRFAVLATQAEDGPRLSLVAFAVTPGQADVVFATPKKSEKYRNIKANRRVAILLDGSRGRSGSILSGETIAIDGEARVVGRGERREKLATLLEARHPELSGFLSAPTTAIVRIEVERVTHVEGFQRVTVLRRR